MDRVWEKREGGDDGGEEGKTTASPVRVRGGVREIGKGIGILIWRERNS